MKALILLTVLFAPLVFCGLMTNEEVLGSIQAVEVVPGQRVRAYAANWWPTINPRALKVVGVAAEKNDNTAEVDAVEFDISTINQMTMAFGYFHASATIGPDGNATDVAAAGFAFILRAYSIIEFEDNDGTPGFQNTTGTDRDQITGWYDLNKAIWRPLAVNTTDVVGTDGQTFKVHLCTAETTDNVFFLRFVISGKPIKVEGVSITPDSMKVDFGIKWFNNPNFQSASAFSSGPSNATAHPNATVGLVTAMAAVAGTAERSTNVAPGTNPSLTFGSGAFKGYYTWDKKADTTVQGVAAARNVYADITDVTEDKKGSFKAGWIIQIMFFSFEGHRPSEVAWDPTFGADIDYATLDAESAGVIAQPTIVLTVILAAIAMFNRKF